MPYRKYRETRKTIWAVVHHEMFCFKHILMFYDRLMNLSFSHQLSHEFLKLDHNENYFYVRQSSLLTLLLKQLNES